MDNQIRSGTGQSVEHAIALLDQALIILDSEHLLIVAAKVEDARTALQRVTGGVACLSPS
jgi:hypothetical protein